MIGTQHSLWKVCDQSWYPGKSLVHQLIVRTLKQIEHHNFGPWSVKTQAILARLVEQELEERGLTMSDRLICQVWKAYPTGGAARVTFLALAELCDERGSCYAKISQIAEIACTSSSTTCVAIQSLRRSRWIVTDRILGQGGMLIFQLNIPKIERTLQGKKPRLPRNLFTTDWHVRFARRYKKKHPDSQIHVPSETL